MALAAAGMADAAMSVQGLLQHLIAIVLVLGTARLNRRINRSNGIVKTVRRSLRDFGMAVPAGRFRIRESRISDQSLMGGLPVAVVRIPAVAMLATNLSVIGFQKRGLNIDFFVQLQRSQRAPSPFTGSFCRLGRLGFDFFHFP